MNSYFNSQNLHNSPPGITLFEKENGTSELQLDLDENNLDVADRGPFSQKEIMDVSNRISNELVMILKRQLGSEKEAISIVRQ